MTGNEISLQSDYGTYLDELVQRAKRGAGHFQDGLADIRFGSLAVYIDHRTTPVIWIVDHALIDDDPECWEHEIRRSARGWRLIADDRVAAPAAQLESATALLDKARGRQEREGAFGTVN